MTNPPIVVTKNCLVYKMLMKLWKMLRIVSQSPEGHLQIASFCLVKNRTSFYYHKQRRQATNRLIDWSVQLETEHVQIGESLFFAPLDWQLRNYNQ